MNKGEKLLSWLIFNVVVALLPVLFNGVLVFARGQLPLLAELVADGELLIISAAISADAIGETMLSQVQQKILTILAGGGCVIFLTLSTLLFGTISSFSDSFQPDPVLLLSLIIFGGTLVASGSAKWIARL